MKTLCILSISLFFLFSLKGIGQGFTTEMEDDLNFRSSSNSIQILNQSSDKLILSFKLDGFQIQKSWQGGKQYDRISLKGPLQHGNPGCPDIPVYGRFIAIPDGAEVSVKLVSFQSDTLLNIDLIPAPQLQYSNDNSAPVYLKDPEIYSKNEFYPLFAVDLSERLIIRGIDATNLQIAPFQYNPITKELVVFSNIEMEIQFIGENQNFENNRLRNRWWDSLLENIFLNFNMLPEISYSKTIYKNSKETGAEYLIICPNNISYQYWADSIRKFRTEQGILTKVVTLEEIGGNSADLIENYIDNAYASWDIPPVCVLFLGDNGDNPETNIYAAIWDNYCLSDNIYGDVDGDGLPDIIPGRICAENAFQLEAMVSKFLEYERTPPIDTIFYNNPITSCGFAEGGYRQLLTESVAGFFETVLNKTTNRINVGPDPMPDYWSLANNTSYFVQYFGPNGLGYIPELPASVNCSWSSTTQDVLDGINSGAFILLQSSGGYEQGWQQPPFNNNDVETLNNTSFPFVWLVNSLNGKFSYPGECLAEKFHRHTINNGNSGAIGVVATSEITYSFVNELHAWGAFDYMWPGFLPEVGSFPDPVGILPAFANVAGKYYLEQTTWPLNQSNKEVIYNVYNYFGDPFTMLYSEVPQTLSVVHEPSIPEGVTNIEISANEDALIGLSVNGELIAKSTGTGSALSIEIPPQYYPDQIKVTVTKQNFYRHESLISMNPNSVQDFTSDNHLLSVLPNPSNGNFVVIFDHELKAREVLIHDLYNMSVIFQKNLSPNRSKININDLDNGIYLLRLKTDKKEIQKKIIIY